MAARQGHVRVPNQLVRKYRGSDPAALALLLLAGIDAFEGGVRSARAYATELRLDRRRVVRILSDWPELSPIHECTTSVPRVHHPAPEIPEERQGVTEGEGEGMHHECTTDGPKVHQPSISKRTNTTQSTSKRGELTHFPDPFPDSMREALIAWAARGAKLRDGRTVHPTPAHIDAVIEEVGEWARGGGQRKRNWLSTLQGWLRRDLNFNSPPGKPKHSTQRGRRRVTDIAAGIIADLEARERYH
jgi:hypothetical protein